MDTLKTLIKTSQIRFLDLTITKNTRLPGRLPKGFGNPKGSKDLKSIDHSSIILIAIYFFYSALKVYLRINTLAVKFMTIGSDLIRVTGRGEKVGMKAG